MDNYLVCNLDKLQYIRPQAFGEAGSRNAILESYDGTLLALAVLLADGNNRGGGDLRSDAQCIGSWAGSRVAIIDDTVCSQEFSQPGMAAIPLQEQFLKLGEDVSAPVFAAILEGEGDYWPCSKFNPNLRLSFIRQRELAYTGSLELLSTAMARRTRVDSLDVFYKALGVSVALSPMRAKIQIQEGLDQLGTDFGCEQRWCVQSVGYHYAKTGAKLVDRVMVSLEAAEGKGAPGATEFAFDFTDEALTVQSLLATVYPGIAFETVTSLADTIKSPEVAKLLSMFKEVL